MKLRFKADVSKHNSYLENKKTYRPKFFKVVFPFIFFYFCLFTFLCSTWKKNTNLLSFLFSIYASPLLSNSREIFFLKIQCKTKHVNKEANNKELNRFFYVCLLFCISTNKKENKMRNKKYHENKKKQKQKNHQHFKFFITFLHKTFDRRLKADNIL